MVSVIIPTYNREAFLIQAVDSVFNQTYRPIECIVVDDGSTDNTEEILSQWKSEMNDPEFKLVYIKQENADAQVARNTGTAVAKGTYIQYLDSDDSLYRDKLKVQVKFLEENKDFDAVFGDWKKGDGIQNEYIKGEMSEDLSLIHI